MSERPGREDDAERDAWLRAALRNAPDADVPVPDALTEAILREAQARTKRSPSVAGAAPARWVRVWRALASPSAGAAFATVVVATTVGLLWWDRPLPEQGPRPKVEMQERAAPAPVVVPAPAPTTAPSAAAPAVPAPAPPARPQLAQRRNTPRPAVPLDLPAAADATQKATHGSDATAPSLPPPAPLAAAPRAATMAEARRAEDVSALSLADLRTSLAIDAAHWSWQRGGGAAQPIGDALNAWLVQLDSVATGRWRRAPPDTPAASDADLRLLHDGRPVHRLRIDGDALQWESSARAGAAERWQAKLSAAEAQALRTALEAATR